jgi:hypothetical protein
MKLSQLLAIALIAASSEATAALADGASSGVALVEIYEAP